MSAPRERVPIAPDENGCARVKHGLHTQNVRVDCLAADGSRVGYLAAVPVADDEVELLIAPDTDVVAAIVYAL